MDLGRNPSMHLHRPNPQKHRLWQVNYAPSISLLVYFAFLRIISSKFTLDRPPCSILVARERPRPRQEAREMAGTMAKTLFQPRARPEATAQIIHPPDGATQDMEPCSNKVTATNESVGKTEAPGVNLKLNPQHFPQGANINVDARCAKPGVALNIEAEKCLPECAMFDVNTEKMGLSGINMDIQLKNDKDKLFEQEQF